MQPQKGMEQEASRVGVHEPFPATTPVEQEFREVYLAVEKQALARAEAMVGRFVAADVVQDVALRLFRKWEELGPDKHTAGYFLTCVTNRAIDFKRRDKKLDSLPDKADEIPAFQVPANDPFIPEIRPIDALRPVLETIPDTRRYVWVMRLQGMSNEDIAARLEISENMVRKHMRLATSEVAEGLLRSGISLTPETLRALLPARTSEATND